MLPIACESYLKIDAKPVTIRIDNTGAIALIKNPEFHQRTKHMDVRWHYMREQVETGNIQIEYVSTAEMAADGLTKALPGMKFKVSLNR
jgi:hypothetical protein